MSATTKRMIQKNGRLYAVLSQCLQLYHFPMNNRYIINFHVLNIPNKDIFTVELTRCLSRFHLNFIAALNYKTYKFHYL